MKRLTGLDDKIVSYDPDVKSEMLATFRGLLRIALGNIVSKNAEEGLDLNQILLKIRIEEPNIEFENGEFRTMKQVVERNDVKMFQHSHGPLTAYLVKCEKESEKKPELEVK